VPAFAFRLVATSLLLSLCLAGTARAADQADRSTLEGYAAWANRTLKSPPKGVQSLDTLAQRLVELTAERRREAGLESLESDPALLPAARAHALDMLERDYAGHVTPDGLDPANRVALLHRRLVGHVGENLAEQKGLGAEQLEGQIGPLAVKVMDGWMESPGHRKNILDPDYTHLAIEALIEGETLLVVQLFAARRALLTQPLPLHVGQGDKLPLAFEQGPGLAVPVQYAYARPDQPAQDLVTLDLSTNQVSVGPGAYLLKFLFPTDQPDRFQVTDGPAILVR
jgi:uncharacterized protein YkwD